MENQHEKIAVSPSEALFISGYSKSLDAGFKSAISLIYSGCYPFPLRFLKIGDEFEKVVMVEDILEVLQGQPVTQDIKPSSLLRELPRNSGAAKRPAADFFAYGDDIDMIIHKGSRSYVSIIKMSPKIVRVFARTGGKTVFEQDFPAAQIERARVIAKNYANSTEFREQIGNGAKNNRPKNSKLPGDLAN